MYNKIDPKLCDSYDLFQIVVPSSLRTIQPFLDDSQKYIRYMDDVSYMMRIIDVEVAFDTHVGILEEKVEMELSSIKRLHCLVSVLHSRFDILL